MVVYLGTAFAGTSARGARATDDLREMFGDGCMCGMMVRCEDVEMVGGLIGVYELIVVGGGMVWDKVILWEVLRAAYANGETASDAMEMVNDVMYYFGGVDVLVGGMMFVDVVMCVVWVLEIREMDSVCVSVSFGYAMGFGFGALVVFVVGVCLVFLLMIGSVVDGVVVCEVMCVVMFDVI